MQWYNMTAESTGPFLFLRNWLWICPTLDTSDVTLRGCFGFSNLNGSPFSNITNYSELILSIQTWGIGKSFQNYKQACISPSNYNLRSGATQEWCKGDMKICYASRVRSEATSRVISSRFVRPAYHSERIFQSPRFMMTGLSFLRFGAMRKWLQWVLG